MSMSKSTSNGNGNRNGNRSGDGDGDEQNQEQNQELIKNTEKKKLFVTTTEVMNYMNSVLKQMEEPNEVLAPRFELQKRLPNGNTIRADERDMAVADMESKFKQAATEVKDLTPQQKLQWAQLQRKEGNQLYQAEDYKEAIDVYLTCLVVKSDDNHPQFIEEVFLPVMNNLAQCTLQLSQYKKSITFCTMALEEKGLPDRPDLIAKLHFRRGKALRLSGRYVAAANDLEKARGLLSLPVEVTPNNQQQQPQPSVQQRALEKELQLVKRSVLEAKKAKLKQKEAMKRLFDNNTNSNQSKQAKSVVLDRSAPVLKNPHTNTTNTLYFDRGRRPYSTLRSRKGIPDDDDSDNDHLEISPTKLPYAQYYLAVIGSIAERLLIWLGDEETIEKERQWLAKED